MATLFFTRNIDHRTSRDIYSLMINNKKGVAVKQPLLFGPGGVIRTPDPYNPIVVRYQTALRPERAAILGS